MGNIMKIDRKCCSHITTGMALITGLMLFAGVMTQPRQAAAATITCSSGVSGCHFNPTVKDGTGRNVPAGQFTGTHARHAGYSTSSAKRQYQMACNRCHPSTAYTNAHQSGFKNITGSSLPKARYSAGAALNGRIPNTNTPNFGYCSNIYCHSTGRASDMGQQRYSSARWGGSESCLGCHGGRTSATGTYARSVGNFTLTTSHGQHLKYPAANVNCQICHSKTATDAATLKSYTGVQKHNNGVRNVTFTDITYGGYTSYKSTEAGSSANTRICANVSCHGGKSRGAWSATTTNNNNTCVHCHGVDGSTSLRADKYNAAPGWGGTGTSTDQISVNTDIRVGAHYVHLSSVYMKKLKCNECHAVPSTPFEGTHMATQRYNSQTLTFAQSTTAKITIGVASGSTPTQLATFSGYTNGTSTKAATCPSVYCHGNRLKNNVTSGTARKPSWNLDYTATPATATSCGRCHGYPPTDGSLHSVGDTTCSACHSHVATGVNPTSFVNKALHVNGRVEASSDCLGCHNAAKTGGVYNPRRIDSDFTLASRHVFSRTVTSFDCVVCHLEGDETKSNASNATPKPDKSSTYHNEGTTTTDRLVNLRNLSNGTGNYPWSRYATGATRYTYLKNMDDFCMSCHNGSGPAVISTGSATKSTAAGTAPTATERLNPWSETTTLTRASGPSNSLTRSRVVNVFSQFSTRYRWPGGDGTMPSGFTNSNYAGNASHHAVRGPRYFGNNANWGTGAWTTQTLKGGQALGTVREKAQLHCADCHTCDTNGHGSATIFMLQDGTAFTGYVAGFTANNAIDKLCWGCHNGNVYKDAAPAANTTRWSHANDSPRPMDPTRASNLGSNCRLCHGGGNGADPDGVTTSRYGGIHGVNGTTLYGSTTRYRFIGGVWMNPVPSTGDAGFNSTATTTCYGNTDNTWAACSSHGGKSGGSFAPIYARPTTY